MMKYILSVMILGLLLVSSVASAETLEIDKNECVYHPEVNKDYCKAEYIIYDPLIDLKKINLVYADFTKNPELKVSDGEFYVELPKLETEYKLTEQSLNTYRVELEGWKSPLLDIDHVLCYDGNCHYEFAWWNASYSYRNAIFGFSNVSANTTALVPINISIDSSQEIMWCNFTVTSTNSTIGYVYWNDYTDYVCINYNEDQQVALIVDEGNGTNYLPDPLNIHAWWNMDGSLSDIVNSLGLTNTGTLLTGSGKIGRGRDFESSEIDYMTTSTSLTHDISNPFTVSFWYRWEGIGEHYMLDWRVGASDNYYIITSPQVAGCYSPNWILTGTALNSNHCGVDGIWYNGVFLWNGTEMRIYINGELNNTAVKGSVSKTNGVMKIGARYIGNNAPFDGVFDNIRLWDKVLTDDEITLMYESGIMYFPYNATEFINGTPPIPPPVIPNLSYELQFCESSSVLHIIEKDLADNGTAVFNEYLINCPHGCYDNITITGSACALPPIYTTSIGFGFIVGFLILIFTLPKVLRKKKGRK